MVKLFVVYILMMNLIGFFIMLIDKKRAQQHQYRIPEKTLWFVALIGGSIGTTLGMEAFRHKTKHLAFKWGFPVVAILQIFLYVYFFIK